MAYILYINGHEMEIDSKAISQTRQVNDIASLESRQSSFTNEFTLPFTPKNVKAMEHVYLVGNQSNIPYQKNEASLYDADSGVCLIFKGWATITQSSNKGYNIYIYDGNIDFYKAIENKTLGDLDLTALEHSKTLAEVVATFDDSKAYKYILADFNGKALYDTNKINIDYLVPSVRASWLVNQIELYVGFKLNGSFKLDPDYLNLWMTYPKATPSNLGTIEIFDSNTGLVANSGLTFDVNIGFTATEQINISASVFQQTFGGVDIRLNGLNVPFQSGGSTFVMNIGDVLTTILYNQGGTYNTKGRYFNKILKKNSLNINFLDELKGISIKEFMNEIFWRFALTLFKSKYDKAIDLKNISEITNIDNAVDWSSKFISKEEEKYIFGSYAQNNWMRYKYNESNVSYNDGFLAVDNKNLNDFKTIIQSKIFSPEMSSGNNLGFASRIYKLWDKEVKDNGTIVYKELENRFYFIRSVQKSFSPAVTIGSESLFTSQLISTAPTESFTGLGFNEIIIKNYSDIKALLNKSKIITNNMFLTSQDVVNIDFSIPYYIEQESSYFMLNKIMNFVKGKKTKCELIKLNF